MSFKSLTLKKDYRTSMDNVVKDFLVPVLSEAVCYQRAVGYFSSGALIELTKGICELVRHGGTIQLIASPALSEDDLKAIEKGYKSREEVVKDALLRKLEDPESYDKLKQDRLGLIVQLISNGVMDIRIAYSIDETGIYHEKIGIMIDADNNLIAFSGSMNETYSALKNNIESFDVFCSWGSDDELKRAKRKKEIFNALWENRENNIVVADFPSVKEEIFKKYKRNYDCLEQVEKDLEESYKVHVLGTNKAYGPRIPDNVHLYDYQEEAIENWIANGYKGIFDMATGTGKTITGLSAMAKLSERLNDRLAVIILCPYQHLVAQWLGDIEKYSIKPIVCFSDKRYKSWRRNFKLAVINQKVIKDCGFICAICTNDTFKTTDFQKIIDKIEAPILLIADEAHNLGASKISGLLDDRFNYSLNFG